MENIEVDDNQIEKLEIFLLSTLKVVDDHFNGQIPFSNY